MYDVAITGLNPDTLAEEPIPFLMGSSEDYPYIRESDGGVREQIDTSAEAGEQSLTGMWWRQPTTMIARSSRSAGVCWSNPRTAAAPRQDAKDA